jgi:hypothetical protein
MDAITGAFEGSINFVGLGKPLEAEMTGQVPCFKGQTAKGFLAVLDMHLEQGYPVGNNANVVDSPYHDIKGHAVDGVCVLAYALKYLTDSPEHDPPGLGFPLYDIEHKTPEVYKAFKEYIKLHADFQGLSGHVKFEGNDKPAYVGVQQVQEGKKVLVGTTNGTADLTVNGGPSNASWKPAHPDAPPPENDFPYWAFQVFLPILCICCPCLAAIIRNF